MKIPIKIIVILLITGLLQLGCNNTKKQFADSTSVDKKGNTINQSELGEIKVITPSEFKEKSIDKTIIDIRTPFEFKRGYIKGAKNINYYSRDFLEQMSKFDKNEPIYIYCRSGNRTSSASRKLSKLGFKLVYDLRGGISNWERTNNEIVK